MPSRRPLVPAQGMTLLLQRVGQGGEMGREPREADGLSPMLQFSPAASDKGIAPLQTQHQQLSQRGLQMEQKIAEWIDGSNGRWHLNVTGVRPRMLLDPRLQGCAIPPSLPYQARGLNQQSAGATLHRPGDETQGSRLFVQTG